MLYDTLAYLVILAAVGLTVRYIYRQTRPGADANCGCGDCSVCGDSACNARDANVK